MKGTVMADHQELFVGIDVGGTSVKEGLFTREGELLGKVSVPTPPLVDEAGYAAVTNGIERLLSEAGCLAEHLLGIGLAVPCPVPADGNVQMMVNISLDFPGLRAALGSAFPQATVRFANDANAAAMGELWQGSARGANNMVFVTIGTGVGGGVVVDGNVIAGTHGAGGEIGHICMNPHETRVCGCGNRGCLEQYSSATGVVNNYLMECDKRGLEPIELSGPSDSRSVFQACREGDEVALAAAETMAKYLGRALAVIGSIVDPETYVIGGGASASADVYLDKVRAYYGEYALTVQKEVPIEVATLGNDAGIIGAAYVALKAAE